MAKPDKKNRHRPPVSRCAVYTRKSSEEGLEQDFNSLHAQREACEAFIKSQQHEGWVLSKTLYDDGGVSGATMDRPALQRLLADIHAGSIDIIVVYKVDRLTRALMDFAKLVEHFDAHNASFVSVTQQFNTTTSMGRLTLNVLLSFAQFEREVTGERIRDKIAASKQKGLWMGGYPPLGYDVKDRQLVINTQEADTVRHIFRHYAELGSVRSLKTALDAERIVSKVRCSQSGRVSGGRPLARGALYLMLGNRLYRGEIVHKGSSYPGQHHAIIDQDLWDQVQNLLATNRVDRKHGANARHPSLLAGLLFDEHGDRMTPSHCAKNGKRYRYYISRPLTTGTKGNTPTGQRIPAAEIEQLVLDRIRAMLSDEASVLEAIQADADAAAVQERLLAAARTLSQGWLELPAPRVRALLCALITRIDVFSKRVDIHLDPSRLPDILLEDALEPPPVSPHADKAVQLTLSVSAELRRAGMGKKMMIDAPHVNGRKTRPDVSLVKLILKAQALNNALVNGGGESLATVAKREGLTGSYMTRLVRLSFLSPDIIRAILDGRHPADLTAAKLTRLSKLPLDWAQQKTVLGFA
jgi:DNA invertase Pin-like site-specific DNA recombinase